MKVWKMFACLVMLCVIISGCVVVSTEAETEPTEREQTAQGTGEATGELQQMGGAQAPLGGSVTVSPTYSEGLHFRSNGDGTCALAGIGTCTSSLILIPPSSPTGDVVVEILPYALKDSIIGAVEIPTTVRALSAASFAGCARLSYVRVAAGNEWYSEYEGVLYSADGSTLVYCPTGRGGELRLHTSLSRIAAGAFADCTGLKTVVYQGTTAAWHGVIVGDDNDALYAAGFRFGA